MQNKTWFKIYRGWQENPMFRSDKDKVAWLWIIEHAVIDEFIVSVNSKPVKIYRGQLCYSISFLAKAWGATPSYVRCFLKHLKLWQAIDTENDKGQTLITICNYSKYQDKGSANDKGIDKNSARQRQGNDNNTKNDKELKNKDITTIAKPFGFDDIWIAYIPCEMNTKGNKNKAIESYRKSLKKISHEDLLKSVKEYIKNCHDSKTKTKHLSSWLNQESWEIEYENKTRIPTHRTSGNSGGRTVKDLASEYGEI